MLLLHLLSCVRACACVQVLSPEEQSLAASNDYNFDHPAAFDFELLVTTLRKLKQGRSVKIPVYDFTTHKRQKDWVGERRPFISDGLLNISLGARCHLGIE